MLQRKEEVGVETELLALGQNLRKKVALKAAKKAKNAFSSFYILLMSAKDSSLTLSKPHQET